MLGQLSNFLQRDIWRIRIRQLPRHQYYLFRPLRILLLALRGFGEDQCQLRASALTYYTLLSIVPVMAMAFGIAKGFGFEHRLQMLLTDKLHGQQEILERIIAFANSLLANTQGGLIAGIGVALLFWAVIKLLGNIENSFNNIWGIQQGRSVARKLSDYLSVMLICPILLIVSSSLTVFVTSQIAQLTERIALLGTVSGLIMLLLKLVPYAIMWALFSFLYMFMPNTRVSLKAGLFAGVVAGSVFQVVQWAYLFFQIGVARYNAIYGSFAALPLFLVWLQLSWLVVLFGAEISFAVDNEETYEFEHDSAKTSLRFQRTLALRIVELCAKQFHEGRQPVDVLSIVHQLEAPVRLVRTVLYQLVNARVLSEVRLNGRAGEAYQPAQDGEQLTVHWVLDRLDRAGDDSVPLVNDRELKKITHKLEVFDRLVQQSADNIPLKDL